MTTDSRFTEHSLYNEIVDKWGEHGAHAEVFRMMLKKIEDLTEQVEILTDWGNDLEEQVSVGFLVTQQLEQQIEDLL